MQILLPLLTPISWDAVICIDIISRKKQNMINRKSFWLLLRNVLTEAEKIAQRTKLQYVKLIINIIYLINNYSAGIFLFFFDLSNEDPNFTKLVIKSCFSVLYKSTKFCYWLLVKPKICQNTYKSYFQGYSLVILIKTLYSGKNFDDLWRGRAASLCLGPYRTPVM